MPLADSAFTFIVRYHRAKSVGGGEHVRDRGKKTINIAVNPLKSGCSQCHHRLMRRAKLVIVGGRLDVISGASSSYDQVASGNVR